MHCQASSLGLAGSPTVLVYRKQPLTSASLETRVIEGKQLQASEPMPTRTKVPPLASACMPVCATQQGQFVWRGCVSEGLQWTGHLCTRWRVPPTAQAGTCHRSLLQCTSCAEWKTWDLWKIK